MMRKLAGSVAPCLGLVLAAGAAADVFPTSPHAAFNFIPFGSGSATAGPCVQHQVIASSLFAAASGGQPVTITSIGFAPNNALANQTHDLGSTTIRLGYTTRVGGAASPTGLSIPSPSGGGEPNAAGAMSLFYDNPTHTYTVIAGGTANFEMALAGTPFVYDPAQGNLLVEIVSANLNTTFSVSRSAGSVESSRAYTGGRFAAAESPTTATRMDFIFTIGGGPTCYANCDGSTIVPFLNVADFSCFLTKFAAGDPYANCDGSTIEPVLNVADFSCFLSKFAAGCSAP
jgi:hypothetical protein